MASTPHSGRPVPLLRRRNGGENAGRDACAEECHRSSLYQSVDGRKLVGLEVETRRDALSGAPF